MNLLFTGDWHIRKTIPLCRIDDFLKIQENVLEQIAQIARENKAKIIIAGDIFDKPRPLCSQELEIMLYNVFAGIDVYYIAGNHDLLSHNMDNYNKGSIGVLECFGNWDHTKYLDDLYNNFGVAFFDYGKEITKDNTEKLSICICHRYCEKEKLANYIEDGITAKLLLEKYNYDVFVCGDNHKSFVYEKNNRIIFNTGCITRQSVTEKDYKPSVILFNTENKKYQVMELLDNDSNAISIGHLHRIKDKDIEKNIDMIKDINLELSFEENLKNYIKKNNINIRIQEKVEESLLNKEDLNE